MSTDPSKDRVERAIIIRAPIERAYAALTDPSLFPTWGPIAIEGALAPGERPVFDFGPAGGGKVAVYVVAVTPPTYFAYRWMQGVTDPAILLGDPLQGPNTLVEFHLETIEDGTRVRVVESGIAALPAVAGLDPATALDHMGKGWELMLGGLPRHFDAAATGLADQIANTITVRAPRERVHDTLLHPERWWASSVDGAIAPGEVPVLDFGQFGKIRIAVMAVEAPDHLAYRWIYGVDDPARRLDDPRAHPSTLVEFRLEDAPDGATIVHQTETGFLALPGDTLLAHFKRAHQAWGVILGMLEMHFAST